MTRLHQQLLGFALLVVVSFMTHAHGAGLDVTTTVYRLLADGSLQTLVFSPPETTVETDDATLERPGAVDLQDDADADADAEAEAEAEAIRQTVDSLVPMLPVDESPVAMVQKTQEPELGPEEVAPGDLLRYEVLVSNATRYSIPAYELEIIEHLAPGVTLVDTDSLDASGWSIELLPAERELDRGDGSGLDAVEDAAFQAIEGVVERKFRLQNLTDFGPGEQWVFGYTVAVEDPPTDLMVPVNTNTEFRLDGIGEQLQPLQ